MALIPESKNLIDQNETKYKSSVSESTFTRMGASINYIINRIIKAENFEWSGFYRVHTYSDGLGGKRFFIRASDISYYYLSNVTGGTSGVTEVNFDVYDDTNQLLGDLFSAPPSIASSVGNGGVVGYNVETSSDINAGAGKAVGTLNYTTLGAGWSIVPKLTDSQVDAQNLFFQLNVKEQ